MPSQSLRRRQLLASASSSHSSRSYGSALKLPSFLSARFDGAVASIAFGVKTPVVDGNVIRVLTRLRALRCGNESARPGARGLRLGPAPAWCELALSDEVEKPKRTRRAPAPQEGCSPADGAECASLVQGECSASLNPGFRLPREPPLRNTSRYRAWARAAAAIAPASGTVCASDTARAGARFREQLASTRCGGMVGAPSWQGATLT